MLGSKIKPSQESKKQYMIQQLNLLGIYETMKGEDLSRLDRYTLRNILAVEMAVRS
jgi:hypothetical protein